MLLGGKSSCPADQDLVVIVVFGCGAKITISTTFYSILFSYINGVVFWQTNIWDCDYIVKRYGFS